MKIGFLSAVSMCAVAIAFAGCGGSSAPTSKARIAFQSPVLTAGKAIPARYACNAKQIWLPVQWGALPSNTAELVLYIGRYSAPRSRPGAVARPRLIAQSIIVGLKPTLHELTSGRPPSGALIGYYEVGNKLEPLCPPKGTTQDFLFQLYALTGKLNISGGAQGGEFLKKLSSGAVAVGTFAASYRLA